MIKDNFSMDADQLLTVRIDIAERLRFVRRVLQLSQEAFSDMLGISWSSYKSYEIAKRDMPLIQVINICNKLDIELMWLVFGQGTPKKDTNDQLCKAIIC